MLRTFIRSILALVALALAGTATAAKQVSLRFGAIDNSVRNCPKPAPPAARFLNLAP